LLHQIPQTDHRIHGGADFMAHIRQKLAFSLIGTLRPLLGLLKRGIQTGQLTIPVNAAQQNQAGADNEFPQQGIIRRFNHSD